MFRSLLKLFTVEEKSFVANRVLKVAKTIASVCKPKCDAAVSIANAFKSSGYWPAAIWFASTTIA